MAKDKWGSLVLAGALSHVDDTVLLGKVVLPPIKVCAFALDPRIPRGLKRLALGEASAVDPSSHLRKGSAMGLSITGQFCDKGMLVPVLIAGLLL